MSACNHFLTLLTVIVICRQPSSLNFPRSFLGWAQHINYHCRPESRRDTIFLHWRSRRFHTARPSQERSSVFFGRCHAWLPQTHVEYLRGLVTIVSLLHTSLTLPKHCQAGM